MILDSIYAWSDKTPEADALIQDGHRLSYRSFARAISRARGFFHRNGCAGGGYAGIFTERQSDFWICSLALRSLGYTTTHVSSLALLQHITASATMLVVFPGHSPPPPLAKLCAEKGFRLLPVDLRDEKELDPDRGPEVAAMGGHLLLTSGTTGDAKFVLVTAEMDRIDLRRRGEIAGIDQDTVLGVFNLPPRTAAGYRWVAAPWRVGGATVVNSDFEVASVLRQPKLTHGFMVPMLLQRALDSPAEAFPRNERLRLMVAGGAMTERQVEQVLARITPNLSNMIASTEAGVITHTPIRTSADMTRHDPVKDRRIEIVDEADRPLEPGATGRIRVLQTGLPDSYHGNEEATRRSFRDGYFYPGDLGALDEDGRLRLHGRLTDLINIGGHKLSPIPAEQQLTNRLGVPACILAGRSASGAEELHVILETDRLPAEEQVMAVLAPWRQFLSSVRIHGIAPFPRTDTGKIIRDSLRTMIGG